MKQSKVSEENSCFKVPILPSLAVYKEKSSKFIALLFPATNIEEAEEVRKKTAKEYYDATHNCYALRIGSGNKLIEKFSDAGEPSHTAGEPILNALKQRNISNAICIVVRYFGGIKLGKGGLIRAYNQSALLAIDSAKLENFIEMEKCVLEVGFQSEGVIRYTISTFNGKICDEERNNNGTILTAQIPKHFKKEFEKKMKENEEKWKKSLTWKWK